jgi:hypothetical protein
VGLPPSTVALAAWPATWPGPVAWAAGLCTSAATVLAADVTKSRTCGTAASAPTTATAGAALPAALATLCACEGAECRPLLLTFLFLTCVAEFTNLPYAGTVPGYSATVPLARPDSAPTRQLGRAPRTVQIKFG